MNRDVVVTPTRAAFAVGSALALTAAVPAIAATPGDAAVTPPASGAAPAASLIAAAPAAPGSTPAAAPVAAPVKPRRNPTPRIRPTVERGAGLVGRTAVYAGRVSRHTAGQRVRLELRNGSGWHVVDRDRVAKNGRFRVTSKISTMGDKAARLRIVGTSRGRGDVERVERVHGFRQAFASYYGPGLYGGALACGGRLTPGTIGVAHKSLPCGSKLTFRLGSREVQARVVDRGPYVGGREFDLTAATKARLGFGSTGNVMVDR